MIKQVSKIVLSFSVCLGVLCVTYPVWELVEKMAKPLRFAIVGYMELALFAMIICQGAQLIAQTFQWKAMNGNSGVKLFFAIDFTLLAIFGVLMSSGTVLQEIFSGIMTPFFSEWQVFRFVLVAAPLMSLVCSILSIRLPIKSPVT